jgi:hypothetical protein
MAAMSSWIEQGPTTTSIRLSFFDSMFWISSRLETTVAMDF